MEAHDQGKGTLAELADRFGVSLSWAWKISSARRRTGSTERRLYRPGPKPRVDREAVRRLLESKPDLYLRELQAELKDSTGVQVSTPHLWKIVGELGFGLKKVALRHRARHRANRQRREAFLDRLRQIAPERLIYLDESGISTQMTRHSATLFARPQPHRKGLGQTQAATPLRQGQNRPSSRSGHRRTTPNHPPKDAHAWFRLPPHPIQQ